MMLFFEGAPNLDSDPVFGAKQPLIMPFVEKTDQRAPDNRRIPSPAFCVDYDIVPAKEGLR